MNKKIEKEVGRGNGFLNTNYTEDILIANCLDELSGLRMPKYLTSFQSAYISSTNNMWDDILD